MSFLKKILKLFLKEVYILYLRVDVLFLKRNKKTLVFDIDNTLANTWPTLKPEERSKYKNEADRLSSLELLPNAKELVKLVNQKFDQILFLSARDPRCFSITDQWIKSNFKLTNYKLVLVPKASLKIIYWNRLAKISKETVVLDDLSYNHENEEVKFYADEIEMLKKHNSIKYFDFKNINEGLSTIIEKL
ncbi:hypothetical protein F7018_17310 [Tenacibaculum aiptasiae]|uniref:Uncharacterized protein n=1 Tax=Tenacibaculum aiptasiae TaxID=426481 RepID=A0A7J5A823_9FLAO|nr:hypothetical protein [Tenacibaculum aiptasiae]KAB1153279.1 hypothetical protein F7018_17310 [Tenacibaculum aiptasiae]